MYVIIIDKDFYEMSIFNLNVLMFDFKWLRDDE